MIYRPDYVERIGTYIDTPFVKILTGVRRSGKSTIMNMLRSELLRRGYDVFVGRFDGYEIDFVATRRDERIYIQVAQEISSEETRLREYSRLLEIDDNYPKYVLLNDDYAGGELSRYKDHPYRRASVES